MSSSVDPEPQVLRLNVAATASRSRIYGPGERFVVWLQGCAIRCPGCWNRAMWDFVPRRLVAPADLAREILAVPGLEGITLLGGEPLHQADALVELFDAVHKAGLSVMLFTGYEVDEVTSAGERAALQRADLVVAGRYDAAQRDTSLIWRGSRNQRVIAQGPRYAHAIRDEANQIEIVLSPSGSIEVRGFPDAWLWQALLA